jgi:mannose-6-phosphate isomerase-like protein (cupin superfamily)
VGCRARLLRAPDGVFGPDRNDGARRIVRPQSLIVEAPRTTIRLRERLHGRRAADVPNYTGEAPGAFLGYGRALGAEQPALSLRVLAPHAAHVPPGGDPTRGHSHRTIEEIYLVLTGQITIKLGDDVTTLGRRDAVRISPATPRAVRNDSDKEAVFLMFSARVDDHRSESQPHDGFWPLLGRTRR